MFESNFFIFNGHSCTAMYCSVRIDSSNSLRNEWYLINILNRVYIISVQDQRGSTLFKDFLGLEDIMKYYFSHRTTYSIKIFLITLLILKRSIF